MMNDSQSERTVVLLGIGHTNAHIVREWIRRPIPDTRLVCISNYSKATYSGMLPGVLAGNYHLEQMEIDLQQLCDRAGARLILGTVTGLNNDRQEVLLEGQPAVRFDAISIGIGSTTKPDVSVSDDATLVPVKPMQTFLRRIEKQVDDTEVKRDEGFRVTVVGGGAAGVEIAFCIPNFIQRTLQSSEQVNVPCCVTLIHRGEELTPGTTDGLNKRVRNEFRKRGVEVLLGTGVTQVVGNRAVLSDGRELISDLLIWCAGATPPPLLNSLELPTDAAGFLLIDNTLKTLADLPIFVVGDSGTMQDREVPKAGVYAVRQGPILWENLNRILHGEPLKPYEPQQQFLKLLNKGNGSAIGEQGRISFEGRWVWWLKNWIDSQFLKKYQDASSS